MLRSSLLNSSISSKLSESHLQLIVWSKITWPDPSWSKFRPWWRSSSGDCTFIIHFYIYTYSLSNSLYETAFCWKSLRNKNFDSFQAKCSVSENLGWEWTPPSSDGCQTSRPPRGGRRTDSKSQRGRGGENMQQSKPCQFYSKEMKWGLFHFIIQCQSQCHHNCS